MSACITAGFFWVFMANKGGNSIAEERFIKSFEFSVLAMLSNKLEEIDGYQLDGFVKSCKLSCHRIDIWGEGTFSTKFCFAKSSQLKNKFKNLNTRTFNGHFVCRTCIGMPLLKCICWKFCCEHLWR